jgi:hypothetical protein
VGLILDVVAGALHDIGHSMGTLADSLGSTRPRKKIMDRPNAAIPRVVVVEQKEAVRAEVLIEGVQA